MTTVLTPGPFPLPLDFTRLPIGSAIDGTLALAGEIDWFALELAKGQLYSFQLVGRDGTVLTDASLYLLGSNGFYDRSISGVFPRPFSTSLSGVIREDGTYYLKVGSLLAGTEYTVRATKIADDYSATEAGSGLLVVGGAPVEGKLDAAQDRDWFGVELEAGRGYVFNVGQSGAGVAFSVAAPSSENPYLFESGYVYVPTTSGMHYLELRGAVAGSYSLSATRPADDAGNAAGVANALLTSAQELNGKFDYAGDIDVMRTQVEDGGVYRVAFASEAVSMFNRYSSGSALVDVWGLSDQVGAGGYSAEQIFKVTGTGDAYLSVGGVLSGNYSMTIQKLLMDDWGDLDRDASSLAMNATLTGQLHAYGDQDSFSFLVEAGKTYEVIGHSDIGAGFSVSPSINARAGVPVPMVRHYSFTAEEDGTAFTYVSAANYSGHFSLTVSLKTDDALAGKLDGSRIDAGGGFDTVRYGGELSDYTVARDGFDVGISKAGAGSATLANVERVLFAGTDALALDVDGIGGTAYRLYRAAFDRAPDKAGVGFWMNALEHGVSLHDIAQGFIASAEFTALYGADLSNTDFVTRLYANILDRAPDAGGFDYWLYALNNGYARADVLANFSESDENVDAVAALIGTGFAYIPYGG